ncbi:magnesium transporter [Ichthyobacterium seriolicida]|uniref:Magnesium transporter MgtE n=1 Tax=Ichthyobacterium seriolicida TaxID=242600 RepID=A0A1J1DW54_9FLAO|nr:magnesium transporter [Ichthyobacterium seriolicida]BAV94095.1 Mg/Co/Ni transporter MgtE / CBS domain [Ichthyobacterium seriolicida]
MLISNLKEYVKNKDDQKILDLLKDMHAVDVAELLNNLQTEHSLYVYNLIDQEKTSHVLIELDEDLRERIFNERSSKEIAENIENMQSDDAAHIINELPLDRKDEVIAQIEDKKHVKDIIDLLRHREGSAGSLMGKELVKVNENWHMINCVREMRKQAEEIEKVHGVYVVNDDNIFLGTLSLKRLLTVSTRAIIKDIYNKSTLKVMVSDSKETVSLLMQKYDLFVLPVVDDNGVLVGKITLDDVVDVITDEAEKDYQLASGISSDIRSNNSILRLTKARLPWLLIGLIGGICGARIIGLFDIAEHIELSLFIPLIGAMSGNVGVQSSAIVVKDLATGKSFDNIWMTLFKELKVSFINGISCSVIIYSFCYILYGIDISVVVSISLIIVMIFASLFGTFVPLALNKCGIDPALATGPFITTSNDILGLFVYFFIAGLVLGF